MKCSGELDALTCLDRHKFCFTKYKHKINLKNCQYVMTNIKPSKTVEIYLTVKFGNKWAAFVESFTVLQSG